VMLWWVKSTNGGSALVARRTAACQPRRMPAPESTNGGSALVARRTAAPQPRRMPDPAIS
jgi:hypothetical protein